MDGELDADEREDLERSIQGHLCTLRIALEQPDLKSEDLKMIDRKLGEISGIPSVAGLVEKAYRALRPAR